MPCRSSCPTQDHETWGACARAADIQIDTHALKFGHLEKAKEKELALYGAARHDGILPDTTKTPDIKRAIELTKRTGRAYRADQPDKGLVKPGERLFEISAEGPS